MTEKPGFSSVAALVMARAQKQLAEENDAPDLALNAIWNGGRWKRSSSASRNYRSRRSSR
jgi:hypothetical protein